MSSSAVFHGIEIALHSYSGARALRVVHPGAQRIDEHRHDRAYIGIHAAGRYRECYDGGELVMSGPCAVLHPPGRPHADDVADAGLETITIEFDPAWLRLQGCSAAFDRSVAWSGGPAAMSAGRLAGVLRNPNAREADLGMATVRFLNEAFAVPAVAPPSWLGKVQKALESRRPPPTRQLARDLDLHPAWLARAYRHFSGEGIADTIRRHRVEDASRLLRWTNAPLADVALEAGFCDQSHMNRCFAVVLGRTPSRVRGETSLADKGQLATS